MPHSYRLPPLVIIVASLTRIVQRRDALLRSLLVPTLLLVAITVLPDSVTPQIGDAGALGSEATPPPNPLGLFFGVAGAGLSILFAVSAFRVLLLQSPPTIQRWGLVWTTRELRFFGALLAISGLAMLPCMILSSLVMPWVASAEPEQWGAAQWSVFALTLLPGAWLFARLAPVLPTVATENPITIKQAWELSHGNGWRLGVVIQGPALLIAVATLVFQWEPSVPAAAATTVVVVVVHQLSTLLGISALSVAFHQLRASEVPWPQ